MRAGLINNVRMRCESAVADVKLMACVAMSDANVREEICEILAAMNFCAVEAGSADAAAFVASQINARVVVLDLPSMRALPLIRDLRRLCPDATILALVDTRSVVATVGVELARHSGADAVLMGPVTATRFCLALETCARRAPASAAISFGSRR